MRLNVNVRQLQGLVKEVLDEEVASQSLKAEIKRVFGPAVVVEGKLANVVAEANDWIDVLERTGRAGRFDFLSDISTRFLDHRDPEIRRFAARVVPEKYLGPLTHDNNSAVRAAVAARVPLPAVKKMMERFKNDDQLRVIYRARKQLTEAGIATPDTEPLGTDPVEGAERMGDAAKTADGPDLSETWYLEQAHKLMIDYNRNIEHNWEPVAVRRFCSATRATSGVVIDETKLLKAIQQLEKEKEERSMERNALRETAEWLERQSRAKQLREAALPDFVAPVDAVNRVLESGLSDAQIVEVASEVFKVQLMDLPRAIRKYCLGESNSRVIKVPCVGFLPSGRGFRALDEQALDVFCEAWNNRQALVGEPVRVSWFTHPGTIGKISFDVKLS